MSLGPVMLGVAGLALEEEDRTRLRHPQTGGVILFSRNYESPGQLRSLVDEIHAIRTPRLVVAVDHEGGRVQRFRDGFQSLPAMASLGNLYEADSDQAIKYAESFAWIMASELLHYGVDLSFSPVLDLGNPISSVIGERAFHQEPEIVIRLANAWIRGMKKAGMEAIGKHFPGHGSVEGDSHHVMPFDRRSFEDIEAQDLLPFRRVIATHLTGILMAHVVYDQVDEIPAGYSKFWIENVLRNRISFDGIVFSDDLGMGSAESAGGYVERANASLRAGCDIILICNNFAGADEVLDALEHYSNPTSQLRMIRMHGQPSPQSADLFSTQPWLQAIARLEQFNQQNFPGESGDLFE
jgi:beta-N-acetylhexosaminidase